MPEVIDRRISFNGGEFSPLADPRIDLAKYRSACRELLNFRPSVYGGAMLRPGTIYLDTLPGAVRLHPVEFGLGSTLLLEFSDLLLRFWTTGETPALVEDPGSPGNPLEVVTPWTSAQLFALQFAQQNDVILVSHPSHSPYRLSHNADDDWDIEAIPIEWPPTLDINVTATTLTPSATTGTGIDLVASADTFDDGHVGSLWIVRHRRTAPSVSLGLDESVATNSSALFVLGEWSCNVATNTGGTWEVGAIVQRSYDNSTWETIRTISSSGVSSGTIAGTELEPAWLRIQIATTDGSPPSSGSFVLEAFDPDHYGIVEIATVTDPQNATADVVFALGGTGATTLWHEPAWSDYRGWPRAISFHEGRLFFGGTAHRPQTVWGSIVDDYFNFRLGSDDDMGLAFTLASDAAHAVQWLLSQESLLVGTTGSEWALGSRDSEKPISASTARAKPSTAYGSAALQAVAVHDAALFVQRGARKVREFVFTFEKNGYVAQDLTLLAEHIATGGIVQVAVQHDPETVVWFVTGEGILAGLAYERSQQVAGWFTYETEGLIESVAVIPGDGEEDQLWLAVCRTIDGNEVRYLERLQTNHLSTLKTGVISGLAYSDAALVYDGAATTTISGLDHLEGEEVVILADGAPHPVRTVEAGEIELQLEASLVIVGLAYENFIEPTFLETGDPNSLSKVALKRLTRCVFEVWNTLGLEISGDHGDNWTQVEFRAPEDFTDEAPPVFTGINESHISASSERQASVRIRQPQPLPCNIMSLHLRYDLNTI